MIKATVYKVIKSKGALWRGSYTGNNFEVVMRAISQSVTGQIYYMVLIADERKIPFSYRKGMIKFF